MTIYDLRCDACGRFLAGPGAGVRFVYDPGLPELRDDSGLACSACWDRLTGQFVQATAGRCAACDATASRGQSLRLRRFTEPGSWRLCAADAAGFLNSLRTVEPKLDPAAFRFPQAPGSD